MYHWKFNILVLYLVSSVCLSQETQGPLVRTLPDPVARIKLPEKRPLVFRLSLSPDAKYVSEGFPGRILVWEIASGEKIAEFLGADQATFLENGLFLTVEGSIGRFYRPGEWDSPAHEVYFGSEEHPIVVHGFPQFDATRQSLVLAECNKIRPPDQRCWVTRYKLDSGIGSRAVPEREGRITSISYSHVLDRLVAHRQAEEPGLELWNLSRGRREILRCSFKERLTGTHLKLSPDGRYVVATNICEDFSIWDLNSSAERKRVELPFSGLPMPVEFSPDGRYLMVSAIARGQGWLAALDTDTLEIVNLFSKPLGTNAGMSFSSDGRYLALQDYDYRVEEFVAEDGRRFPKQYKVPYISIFEFKDLIE